MEETQQNEKDYYQQVMDLAWDNYNSDNLEDVERACLQMIEQYPEKAGCHYLLGLVYHGRKHFLKAVDEFLLALQNDLTGRLRGYICYWLGLSYGERGWGEEQTEAVYIYDKEKSQKYFKLSMESKSFPPHTLLQFRYDFKGQQRIELFEKGIEHFSDMADFYLMLSDHYKTQGLSNLQISTLNRAVDKGIKSASLEYNLGDYAMARKDFVSARVHFDLAAELNENSTWNFAIDYHRGMVARKLDHDLEAEQYFQAAYDQEKGGADCLFGFFGLFDIYSDRKDRNSINELLLNLELSEELFYDGSRVSRGPVFLAEHAMTT